MEVREPCGLQGLREMGKDGNGVDEITAIVRKGKGGVSLF